MHTVSYPAYSISGIGDFPGGDCLITLSRMDLTISSLDNRGLATWQYSTIRGFSYSHALGLFWFTSGRRGPYGAQEYEFTVHPLKLSSLFSVLSEVTGMKVERYVPVDGVGISEHNVAQQMASDVKTQPVGQFPSSCCYKVANSTFYTDLPSENSARRNVPKMIVNPMHTLSPLPAMQRHQRDFWGEDGGSLATPTMLPNIEEESQVHPSMREDMLGRNSCNSYNYIQHLSATNARLPATSACLPSSEYLQLLYNSPDTMQLPTDYILHHTATPSPCAAVSRDDEEDRVRVSSCTYPAGSSIKPLATAAAADDDDVGACLENSRTTTCGAVLEAQVFPSPCTPVLT